MANYINGVKLKKSKFGIKFSGKTQDFIEQLKSATNDKGYFNLVINERKEEGKFGDTHYLKVDEYTPQEKTYVGKGKVYLEDISPILSSDDLPF